MANNSQLNQKSVETAEQILADLKAKAKTAHDQKDVFAMSLLTDLIKAASPIVTRAINRLHREENAAINKAHKELRAETRGQSPTPSDI